MKLNNIVKCFFLAMLGVSIFLIAHATSSIVTFIDPTPADNSTIFGNGVTIKIQTTGDTIALDWNKSLASWWRFNSEAGESSSLFKDWSAYANNATCTGISCPTLAFGKFDQALQFDGKDDYLGIKNSSSLNISKEITMSLWFKTDQMQNGKFLLEKGTGDYLWGLYLTSGSKSISVYIRNNNGDVKSINFSGNFNDNNWYHFVGTFDGRYIKLYSNGELRNTYDWGSIQTIKTNNEDLNIGSWYKLQSYFKGLIDDPRIYGRALSSSEIKSIYDAQINPLTVNISGLSNGQYFFSAYAQDNGGVTGVTERRIINIGSCSNLCSDSAKQCSGDSGYQICKDTNGDGCYEWSSVTSCGTGETCFNGKCISPAEKYTCTVANQVSGCKVCYYATMKWADDSTRCGAGQACVDGYCVNGQPLVPTSFDVMVEKNGNTAIAKNVSGNVISSGTDYAKVIRAAVIATPEDGTLYIGEGTYDNLVADQLVYGRNYYDPAYLNFYVAIPIRGKNIRIYGAGMGKTILKLADNQYYANHPALIIYANNGTNNGYYSFTLANMTFDGNKTKQSPYWYDGAGLVLTASKRTGGKFFNLELKDSPNSGIYWGNSSGGWESYAYIDNIYSHDNLDTGIVFDNIARIKAGQLKSVNDAGGRDYPTSGIGIFVINMGNHNLDLTINGADVKNGMFEIGGNYDGAGGITINDLTIDNSGKDFSGKGSLYIKSRRAVNQTHLVPNPNNITININSITAGNAADNRAIYMTQTPAKVILNGGVISGYISLKADYKSTVEVNGARLKSTYDSVFTNSSHIKCNNCILEPTKGQYMYSSIGSGAEIYFDKSFTTTKEKIVVSSGKVYGELALLSEKCTPNSVFGCKICNSAGTAWVDTDSKCLSGQICSAGKCITQKYRIACFGDSITYANIYCTKLKTLGNYETFNHGISGNTTVKLLARMNDVLGKDYDHTVLLIGTNDLNTTNKISIASYYNNLANIVQQLKNDGQKVVISTIPPCNNWTVSSCKVGDQTGPILMNKVVRRISYDNNLCYADIFSKVFGSDYKSTQFKDIIHPNDSAHIAMAAVFNDVIKNCKPFDCKTTPNDCYLMQTCIPNSVSGCKVCNAGGTAWVDTDSKCSSSQECSNGVCVAKCTSQCEKNTKKCNGNIIQICADINNDGCYEWKESNTCNNQQNCVNGGCEDKITDVCNSNDICDGIENEANCSADCSGYCVSSDIKKIIDDIWAYRKPLLISNMKAGLEEKNTYPLYDIQTYTNNLLKYSDYCRDYKIIDDLASVYLTAYPYLTKDKDGYKKWIYDNAEGPAARGLENIIISSQFSYLLSNAINIIASIDNEKRTAKMNELVSKYTPILVNDHYSRWSDSYSSSISEKINKKTYVTDADMWMTIGPIEILSANKKDPELVNLSNAEKIKLSSFVKLGINLIKSRITTTSLTNFSGAKVSGVGFDFGAWANYPDYAYAGYSGKTFPVSSDKKTVSNVGWDISHARRLVHVFTSLYENKDIVGESFPDINLMKGLSNQLSYKIFNKNLQKPLFTNFIDGTAGWYRVGYSGTGFGYPPYGMNNSYLTAGYSFWAKFNSDMYKISSSLWNLLNNVWNNSNEDVVNFAQQNYASEFFNNYKRDTSLSAFTKSYNKTNSLNLLMFLPSLSTKISKNLCTPNSTSGCKVCNAGGTAWVDTDSKCKTNEKCSNGYCIAKCIATCTVNGAKQCNGAAAYQICSLSDGCLKWGTSINCGAGKNCSGAGICKTTCTPKTCTTLGSYKCGSWSDGCGSTITCGICASGKTCSNGECVANCTSHLTKKCADGNLYWYNSCNAVEELAENCGSDETTDDYQCSGNWTQRKTIRKGCASSACTKESVWANNTDCAAENKICSAGICKTRSSGGGSSFPGSSSSSSSSSSKMTRDQIVAKINEIVALIAELQKQLNAILGKTTTYSCAKITQTMFYGRQNDVGQVKCLQEVLRAQGYAITISGTYDLFTQVAVKQFQEKYSGEILVPYGLKSGSGNVGNGTMAKINGLME